MAKLRSLSPIDNQEIGSVKIATKAEIEEAVKQARLSIPGWRSQGLLKRGKILLKLAQLLARHQKKLAELITLEMGKPITQAEDEIKGAIEEIEYYVKTGYQILRDEVIEPKLTKAQEKQMADQVIDNGVDFLVKNKVSRINILRYLPVGVVAAIKPWNYPISTVVTSVVPALLAGNAVVFKPSEYVPLVSQELAKLVSQAGVPSQVFQVLFGRSQAGEMLVNTGVDMVSFTGSSQAGKEIADKCSSRLIKHTLELGGSSAAIVLKDADLDLAAREIVSSRFYNCGQSCDAIKRVFVDQAVAKKLIDKLIKLVADLRVGDPRDRKTEVGPLVSEKQFKEFQKQVTKGVIQSGRILVGGRRMREEPFIQGWFHEMTLMTYVGPKNEIMQEETFGPILPIGVVDGLEQAIKYANSSRFGLTAAIFTKSKSSYQKALIDLEAGAVIVNRTDSWDVRACWGGVKDSGVGVELGKHGIWAYTRKQHINLDLDDDKKLNYWFKTD